MLIANASVRVHLFTKDMHVRNFKYAELNHQKSPSPHSKLIQNKFSHLSNSFLGKNNGSILSSSKKSKMTARRNGKPPKIDITLNHKDNILKGVNQAQIIEELLKKKGGLNQQSSFDNSKYADLFIKLDLLNKDYIDLIKKFQELQKENCHYQK